MDVPVKVHVRIKPNELHSDSKESQKQILVKLSSTKVSVISSKLGVIYLIVYVNKYITLISFKTSTIYVLKIFGHDNFPF